MIRLLELRTEKGLSQRNIAKELHISQGTYNNWENAKTQPSIEQLIILADFFDVSIDYLVGHSDDYGTIGMNNALSLSSEEQKFITYIRTLSPDMKKPLLELLSQLK